MGFFAIPHQPDEWDLCPNRHRPVDMIDARASSKTIHGRKRTQKKKKKKKKKRCCAMVHKVNAYGNDSP